MPKNTRSTGVSILEMNAEYSEATTALWKAEKQLYEHVKNKWNEQHAVNLQIYFKMR